MLSVMAVTPLPASRPSPHKERTGHKLSVIGMTTALEDVEAPGR
jgi:hypothetical protein